MTITGMQKIESWSEDYEGYRLKFTFWANGETGSKHVKVKAYKKRFFGLFTGGRASYTDEVDNRLNSKSVEELVDTARANAEAFVDTMNDMEELDAEDLRKR